MHAKPWSVCQRKFPTMQFIISCRCQPGGLGPSEAACTPPSRQSQWTDSTCDVRNIQDTRVSGVGHCRERDEPARFEAFRGMTGSCYKRWNNLWQKRWLAGESLRAARIDFRNLGPTEIERAPWRFWNLPFVLVGCRCGAWASAAG